MCPQTVCNSKYLFAITYSHPRTVIMNDKLIIMVLTLSLLSASFLRKKLTISS